MNNIVTLVGRVGAEPVEHQYENSKLVKFPIAVQNFKKDAKDMWLDVEAWNGTGDKVKQLVTVGRQVAITGQIAKSRPYVNKDGIQVVEPVVKLSSFFLCGSKPPTPATPEDTPMQPDSE
jgi:single-stranded DNA-binding protein